VNFCQLEGILQGDSFGRVFSVFRSLYGEILKRAIFGFFKFEYPMEKPQGEGAIVFSLGQTKLN
jgi:hypothetical protein